MRQLVFATSNCLIPLAFAPAATAAPREIPGSRIAVDLPENYVPLPVGTGFLDLATEVAVVALDRPRQQCTPEGFAMPRRQLEDSLVDITQGKLGRNEPHVYRTGKKSAGAKRQFIVSFCGPASGAVVLVEMPEAALASGKITTVEIERILTGASATEKPAVVIERYRLTELGPFKPVRGALSGPLRFYSLDGTTKGGGTSLDTSTRRTLRLTSDAGPLHPAALRQRRAKGSLTQAA